MFDIIYINNTLTFFMSECFNLLFWLITCTFVNANGKHDCKPFPVVFMFCFVVLGFCFVFVFFYTFIAEYEKLGPNPAIEIPIQ